MNSPSVLITLMAHLALLSSISFGGFPTVLPDVRDFVVVSHGWMTDQDFTNFFALAQAVPGPNMILMMGFVGWKVWEFPEPLQVRCQLSGRLAPSILLPTGCGTDFVPRHGSALFASALPVTVGLVIGSGTVMARAADTNWPAAAVTVTAAALMLRT